MKVLKRVNLIYRLNLDQFYLKKKKKTIVKEKVNLFPIGIGGLAPYPLWVVRSKSSKSRYRLLLKICSDISN